MAETILGKGATSYFQNRWNRNFPMVSFHGRNNSRKRSDELLSKWKEFYELSTFHGRTSCGKRSDELYFQNGGNMNFPMVSFHGRNSSGQGSDELGTFKMEGA
jgi:hypothetical protein